MNIRGADRNTESSHLEAVSHDSGFVGSLLGGATGPRGSSAVVAFPPAHGAAEPAVLATVRQVIATYVSEELSHFDYEGANTTGCSGPKLILYILRSLWKKKLIRDLQERGPFTVQVVHQMYVHSWTGASPRAPTQEEVIEHLKTMVPTPPDPAMLQKLSTAVATLRANLAFQFNVGTTVMYTTPNTVVAYEATISALPTDGSTGLTISVGGRQEFASLSCLKPCDDPSADPAAKRQRLDNLLLPSVAAAAAEEQGQQSQFQAALDLVDRAEAQFKLACDCGTGVELYTLLNWRKKMRPTLRDSKVSYLDKEFKKLDRAVQTSYMAMAKAALNWKHDSMQSAMDTTSAMAKKALMEVFARDTPARVGGADGKMGEGVAEAVDNMEGSRGVTETEKELTTERKGAERAVEPEGGGGEGGGVGGAEGEGEGSNSQVEDSSHGKRAEPAEQKRPQYFHAAASSDRFDKAEQRRRAILFSQINLVRTSNGILRYENVWRDEAHFGIVAIVREYSIDGDWGGDQVMGFAKLSQAHNEVNNQANNKATEATVDKAILVVDPYLNYLKSKTSSTSSEEDGVCVRLEQWEESVDLGHYHLSNPDKWCELSCACTTNRTPRDAPLPPPPS